MNSTGVRLLTWYRRLPPSTTPIVLIVLIVLLGNIFFVAGLANNDPISWTAGISHQLCHVTCGRPMIDPNVGFITQPLGHQSALDLLHGHLPWWNYFQGLGQPLVGEMQSAALFPLTLLFALSSGLVWFHISLEVIAGVSTYFLARRLSFPIFFATVAGMLFALNGTYAWLGNAVLNPVAFLPMLLLGVEMIFDTASSSSKRGWYIAAIALALSLYAGFPEVAYFDGLFCGAWAVVRLFSIPRVNRPRALRRLGLGGVMGVLLALPVLVPFEDFLKVGDVGGHAGSADALVHLPTTAAPMMFDPYVYGTLFSNTNVNPIWGMVGGYFGAGVCALALIGPFGPRLRRLRTFLAVWSVAGVAGEFNILHARVIWNLIPLVKAASFPRYIMPSCEMAVILLAVFGLMDFAASTRAKRLLTTASIFMVLVLLWSVREARSLNHGFVQTHKAHLIVVGLGLLPFIAMALYLVLGRFAKARLTTLLVAIVVVGESLLLFMVPTAESAKQITIDYAPIHFLQQHQGRARFVDFAVLTPNWGTEFGLNELSSIDLPFPRAFKDFIEKDLYPGLKPGNQFLIKGGMTGIVSMESEVVTHLHAYENASVKYLLIPSSVIINPQLTTLGVTRVFHDSLANIYQLPHTRSFFSTTSTSCTVTSSSDDQATVNCPSTGATLLRTELSMPGWKVAVNGQPATITTVKGVYQQVALPKGTSTIDYSYFPPHERYAILLALLGVLFLIGSLVDERRPFARRRRPRS
ncbi:MAG TPA: hypothetical protein VND89_11555 [Acidimicrobiales bacterium]|nr:hypothetical protein [Acidimicrobiales bacterium]